MTTNALKSISLLLILLAPLASGCSDIFGVGGSGEIITLERQLPAFDRIVNESSIDVEIRYGSEQSVSVKVDDNLQDLIETTVTDGTIRIRVTEPINPSSRAVIDITMPILRSISLDGSADMELTGSPLSNDSLPLFTAAIRGSGDIILSRIIARRAEGVIDGSGDLVFSNLTSDTVVAEIDGSGNLTVAGKGNVIIARLDGSGDILAKRFIARIADAEVDGSGDIEVHATERLRGHVHGSGDIRYGGNPADTDIEVSGSGDVERL